MHKQLLLVLGLTLLATSLSAAPKALNVVIVVIDGPRYSETWGEPTHSYIPVLSKQLAPVGVVYTNFQNMGSTKTNPGHTALTSGHYEDINNSGKELPSRPTILQQFIKHSGCPTSKVWLVTSKDKLAVLANTTDPKWIDTYTPAQFCGQEGGGLGSGYGDDADTLVKVLDVIKTHTPRLLVVNFREPDSSGHAVRWNRYLKEITKTDAYLAQIYAAVQQTPGMKDNTILFVTNDHGRHTDGHKSGYVSHGDDCEGCRHILLYATGPGVKKGVIIGQHREQIDLAVTAAHILGFVIPESKGSVMSELFE